MFDGKLLADRVETVWGTISLVTAERMLLEEALKDPANQKVCWVLGAGAWCVALVWVLGNAKLLWVLGNARLALVGAGRPICAPAASMPPLTASPPPRHAARPLSPLPQFLLISDSDIPLYDPLTFYQQVRWHCCCTAGTRGARWHCCVALVVVHPHRLAGRGCMSRRARRGCCCIARSNRRLPPPALPSPTPLP